MSAGEVPPFGDDLRSRTHRCVLKMCQRHVRGREPFRNVTHLNDVQKSLITWRACLLVGQKRRRPEEPSKNATGRRPAVQSLEDPHYSRAYGIETEKLRRIRRRVLALRRCEETADSRSGMQIRSEGALSSCYSHNHHRVAIGTCVPNPFPVTLPQAFLENASTDVFAKESLRVDPVGRLVINGEVRNLAKASRAARPPGIEMIDESANQYTLQRSPGA